MEKELSDIKSDGFQKLLVLSLGAVIAIGGVTFKLVLERMDKQETIAAADIAALREEIKTTKADAKDAVSAAAIASKDAVAATASALKDSVAGAAVSSKDAVAATASVLSEKIELLHKRVEKLEDRAFEANKKDLNHK